MNIEGIAVDDSSHYSQKNSIKRTLVLMTQYREALLRKIKACDLLLKNGTSKIPSFD